MTWIYAIPTIIFSIALIGAMVILACLGHWLFYRYIPHRDFVKHNDVAGFVLAIVGVIYAVLLSFVVVVVWQEYEASDSVAQREASAIGDMYRLAAEYPSPWREQLRSELLDYVHLMIADEWPAMRLGNASEKARALAGRIGDQVVSYTPRGGEQVQVQLQVLEITRVFFDSRRQRLHENQSGLPAILWWTLIASAIITVGFVYLFGMENLTIQLLMTGALAAIIGLMFTLIIELDYPFRGDTSISPHSWHLIENQLKK